MGKRAEALAMVQGVLETDQQVFGSTFLAVLLAMLEEGEHDRVVELLTSTPAGRFTKAKEGNGLSLCYHYMRTGEEEKLAEVRAALVTHDWVDPKDRRLAQATVHSLLAKGDMPAVMEEVERVVKELRAIPAKQEVLKKLIEMEDLELLQRVLDASIELAGEEQSLYDLILAFLDLGKLAQAKKLMETPGLRCGGDLVWRTWS